MRRHRLRELIGWDSHLRPFLFKKLPARTGWFATLGTLCALLFATMAASGIVLAMYYNPSPDKAYASINFLMTSVPLGALLRGIHHWCAGAMVIAVFLHLLASFFGGRFKAPRQLTWVAGVCLLFITLGLGFTGYLLPWDMKAYWATIVSTNISKGIPFIGPWIAALIRGGASVSGLTLTRFYAVHMLLLPALFLLCATLHIYLVRLHGLAEPAEESSAAPEGSEPVYRFFPEHMFRSALVFLVVFAALMILARLRPVPQEPVAGTIIPDYLPRPEWYYMWLFQLLTYFSGSWETVGSLLIPSLAVVVLFALPFLDRSKSFGARNRPVATAAGVTCIIAVVYLSLMGFEGARPYGKEVVVPDRMLTPVEARGLQLFAQRECAYCHQILGRGGHRVGPDLSNLVAKHRTEDYLARYIKNPAQMGANALMPHYDLSDSDLRALAEFLRALDFSRYSPKTLTREQALQASSVASSRTTQAGFIVPSSQALR